MRRNKKIVAVVAMLLSALTITACSDTNNLSFGTGNVGGNYYTYGNAYAGIMQNYDINVTVKTTAGSAANLRLLQNGFLDMAIVQSDTLLDAYKGTGVFADNKCDGVRALAGLYIEECQIVVAKDSDIQTVDDLYGKKVSVGEEESGVMQNAEQILFANGMSFDELETSNLSFADAAAALKEGSIDAFFCTAGSPTTSIAELAKEYDIRLISLDDLTCQKLIRQYPSYSQCVIPAGTYEGQTEDVKTLGVKAVLVVSNKLMDEEVKYLTRTLFENTSSLQYATAAKELDTEFAVDAIPVPFHAGAAQWYAENGITVATSDEGMTSFGVNAGQD